MDSEMPPPVVLGKPHSFADVGKHARDLLYKGFAAGHTLMVSCMGPGGAMVSTTASMFQGAVTGIVSTSFKSGGVLNELSGSTLSQITASTTYDDLAPGLKVALTTAIPGAADMGKAQVHYQHRNAALDATMFGLKSKPVVQLSVNLGSDQFSLGGSGIYNSETSELSGTRLGFGYMKPGLTAALLYDPFKENIVDGYFTHVMSPTTTVAGHVNYKMEKQVTAATFGALMVLDERTTLKARVDNSGILGAVFEHQPNPFATVGLFVDVDTKNLQTRTPNVGLTVSILGGLSSSPQTFKI